MTGSRERGSRNSADPDRPIFVIGFQRSGTTLLQALIGAHPRIASPPETFFLFRVYQLRDYWGDLRVDRRLRRVVHEMLNPMIPLFVDCGFDEDRLFDELRSSDRTYRSILDAMMRDFALRQGKRRWSEKTPGQLATEVWELFPDAQVVHIVRDPRHTVRSSASMPWERDHPVAIARRYVEFTLQNIMAGTERGPAHYLRVRYEDLCLDPETTMRLVCSFLGENYDPGMVADRSRREASLPSAGAPPWQRRAMETIAPASGADRQQLGPLDRARVGAIVSPLLAPHGYRPPSGVARVVGKGLNVLTGPAQSMSTYRAAVRARRSAATPEERYVAYQQFQRRQAHSVWGVWPELPEPPAAASRRERDARGAQACQRSAADAVPPQG